MSLVPLLTHTASYNCSVPHTQHPNPTQSQTQAHDDGAAFFINITCTTAARTSHAKRIRHTVFLTYVKYQSHTVSLTHMNVMITMSHTVSLVYLSSLTCSHTTGCTWLSLTHTSTHTVSPTQFLSHTHPASYTVALSFPSITSCPFRPGREHRKQSAL